MKFGDSFHQRSIPEWSTHNIDYNDLKELIKRRTTRGIGDAQPIPGDHNEAKALEKFEDELCVQLKDQHARVDLFVRSKSGEYARKLTHLLRQITDLERRSFSYGQTKISVRRLERFSKLEDQTLRTGSDIQSLVQFANANRLALQKLLKKYKKWTGSSGLGYRFRREILNSSSNLNSNFEPLVKQYIDTLASVREPFITGVKWHAGSSCSSASYSKGVGSLTPIANTKAVSNSGARDLNRVNQTGSRVQLDTALATIPLGEQASRAVYWIHPDNVVQLQILLLQYTRIPNWSKSPTPSRSSTGLRPTPRESVSGPADDCMNAGGQDFGLVVCDELAKFAARQNSEPIGDVETSCGSTAERATASLRYSTDKELVLAIANGKRRKEGLRQRSFQIAKFRRSSVHHLFDSSSDEDCMETDSTDDCKEARQWLAKHPNVAPLVQIQYKRSHFIGIQNTEMVGAWATLDTEVQMRRCSKSFTSAQDGSALSFSSGESSVWQQFPLAILEVRIEGPDAAGLVDTLDAAGLVDTLDASHLVTRIRGFSIETHAVATLCQEKGMRPPIWLSRLEDDMRKLPRSTEEMNGKIANKQISPEQPSTRRTSISAPSTVKGQSSTNFSPAPGESSATSAPEPLANPPLSAFKKKKKKKISKKRRLPPKELRGHSPTSPHYWNEFDDGSEGERDEPYTIFVDANSFNGFPGMETVSYLSDSISTNSKAAWGKIKTYWRHHGKSSPAPGERTPLINGTDTPTSPIIEDSSDSDNGPPPTTKQPGYSTITSHHHRLARSSREIMLVRSTLGSFIASLIFALVAAILVSTGRRTAAAEVDIGVVICVAASIASAVIAVGCIISRRDRLSWVYRSVVGLTVVLVVLANAGVMVGLGHVRVLD